MVCARSASRAGITEWRWGEVARIKAEALKLSDVDARILRATAEQGAECSRGSTITTSSTRP
jgi:hypothetical protein